MDLVIARGDFAVGIDHERAIGKAPGAIAFGQHRQRSDMQPDSGTRRSLLQGAKRGVVGFGHDVRTRTGTLAIEQTGHFGGKQHCRPLVRRARGSRDHHRGIGGGIDTAGHLQHGDAHRGVGVGHDRCA